MPTARRGCLALSLTLAAGTAGVLPAQQVGIGVLEARATADSNDSIAHYELAMGYWDQKRWNEAERSLQQAIAISPNYADAYLALSQLPLKRGQKYWKEREKKIGEEATRTEFLASLANYRRAFLLNPLVDLRLMGKVDLAERVQFVVVNGRLMIFGAPTWAHDLEKAINSLNTGKYEDASAQIEKLVARKPFVGSNQNLPDQLLWWRGLIAAHRDSFAQAVDAFAVLTGRAKAREQDTAVVDPSPMRTNDYRFILATLLFLDGRYPQAIPTFRRSLEVDLGLFAAHVQLARMHEARGEYAEAVAERQLAVDVSPDNSDLLVDLAGTMIRGRRFADAVPPLEEAERLNARDPRIPYLLGVAHEELEHGRTADSAYTRFLAIAPSRFAQQKLEVSRRLQARP